MPDVFVAEGKEGPKKEKTPSETKTYLSQRKIRAKPKAPLWSSYIYYPENVKFSSQESEEKIILLLRRHFITNLGWIILGLIMIFAPLVLEEFPILEFLPERFQTVAVLIWYLVTTAFIFEKFIDWFFNVYIITDERVIDVDFLNLIYREITDADIEKIQDVTVQMGGVVRSIFNYGNLLIQTAAEIPLIEFTDIPQPDKIAKILEDLRMQEKQEVLEGRVR